MSTRCQIALYSETPTTKDEVLGKWDVLLYHHSDGYPSYMLKLLRDGLKFFKENRGLGDTDYLGAYLMYDWKTKEQYPNSNPCISHGIDKDFHGDIQFLYCISEKDIKVYSTNFWEEKNMNEVLNFEIEELLRMTDLQIEAREVY